MISIKVQIDLYIVVTYDTISCYYCSMQIINQILLVTTFILFAPMVHSEIKFSDRVESYYLQNGLKVFD